MKAIAALNGKMSEIATAEYVLGTAVEVNNIAAYKTVADETQVKFASPVTVLAQNGNNIYVKDLTGYTLFYGSTGVTLKNGDEILAGFNGKKTTYKGEAELVVNTYSNFHKGANNPVAAEPIQVSDIAKDMFGQLRGYQRRNHLVPQQDHHRQQRHSWLPKRHGWFLCKERLSER